MDKFTIEGYEKRDFIVKKFGKKGGHIILPGQLVDKKVKVVFMDEIEKSNLYTVEYKLI